MTSIAEKKGVASKERVVYGRVTYAATGVPAAGVRVEAMDSDLFVDDVLGETTTDEDGAYRIEYRPEEFITVYERAPDIYLRVFRDGTLVTTTEDSVVRNAGAKQEIHVELPGSGPEDRPPVEDGPTVTVGGTPVDRRSFDGLGPETTLSIARTVIAGEDDEETTERLASLNPDLVPERLREKLCLTPLVLFLEEAIRLKDWPREVRLELEDILIGFDGDAAYETFECPNFTITYETSGSDAVPTDDSGGDIVMPGTGTVVGSTTGGNGVPDYIEKLCFWLENALAVYTSPPFDLRTPAVGGKIQVTVTGGQGGTANRATNSMTVGRNLNDDLLAAIPTHELMHLVQYQYEGSGTGGVWRPGTLEGGAVLGEDVVFDTHNRYIVEATNGGTLDSPATSLNSSGLRYELALFWKYVSEQQSGRVGAADEPAIGVETYRRVLETFDAQGQTTDALREAVGVLPWHQRFDSFEYLDPGRLDELNAETLLGNFWLACYLKDFGVNVPDRRFEFMEDEDEATWDQIFFGSDTVATLGDVALTTDTSLGPGGTLSLSAGAGGSVNPFAARFYRVGIDAGVDTFRIDFQASAGFDAPIVQAVLVDENDAVRDIVRSDRTTWSRTVANDRGGTALDHVVIVVAGTESGGSFSLSVQEVSPASDVMVTRWHHVAGTSYEIDPFGWSWTWTSPDVWVDNDGNGLADDEVFFDEDNTLTVRLHNHGHVDATGVSVDFHYQDASTGLSHTAWLPVENTAGVVQQVTGATVPAEGSATFSVDWAPAPSGTSDHFCIRAVVTAPGDPNTDNKRCVSNFGNVIAREPYIDLDIVRRLPEAFREARFVVVPRGGGRWFASPTDRTDIQRSLERGEREAVDTVRLRRRASLERHEGHVEVDPKFRAERTCPNLADLAAAVTEPDPFGDYETDPDALPPGVADAPLVTVAHVADGSVTGGFTWAIREERD